MKASGSVTALKQSKDVTCCCVDYGNFLSLADKLGEQYKKVYYYAPYETEYRDITKCVTGIGAKNCERIGSFFEPDIFKAIDLFIFPDIGYCELQCFLEECGKAVWGSREITHIELSRSLFLDVLEQVGLPVPKCRVVKGLAALEALLEKAQDKWIKLDEYRANMETWHHLDYEHSLPMLRYLATAFGGCSEDITFVVQDPIPDAEEQGYDGFCINGKFPRISFQGYEKKNELYLGSWLKTSEMPTQVQRVNEHMAPLLKKAGYKNFWATEIRDEFFIDPTPRMAGQSQEHLQESCSNLADIIWAGANGELVEPEFTHKFAASATLHYKEVPGEASWKSVRIPPDVERWFKLANCHRDSDVFNFPPGKCDEIGVVIGLGDTVGQAIGHIKTNLEAVKCEPIEAEIAGFVDLIKDIEKAQARGDKFSSKPLPSPEQVMK
jgi:hypothetical protein